MIEYIVLFAHPRLGVQGLERVMTEEEEKLHAAFKLQLEQEAAAKMAAFIAAIEAIGAEATKKAATLVLKAVEPGTKH